jgi:alginate production protein
MSASTGTNALTRGRRRLPILLSLCLALPGAAMAAPPEYNKLGLKVGMGIEASGRLNGAGFFVASDLQVMAESRRPKLRADLTDIDAASGVLTVLGRTIAIGTDTEFEGGDRASLRRGQRIEVSCAVDATSGRWSARSVTSGPLKASDKIKGTITSMQYDGRSPDTLSISGLMILLDDRTDMDEASAVRDQRDKDLFAVLASPDATGLDGVHAFDGGRMGLAVQYRQNVVLENELDLTSRYDSDLDELQPSLRVRWSGFWTPNLRSYVEARARRDYVLDSDLNTPSDEAELHLVQAWALWNGGPGLPVALAVGRQDYDEEREWLYDEYLDAVRAVWLPANDWCVQTSLIHAVTPLKEKSTTWTDALVVADHYLDKHNRLSAYLLSRRDSDATRNREPLWLGLRYYGEPRRGLTAWGELSRMTGQDKYKPLKAWAMDLGGTMRLAGTPGSPALTVGYALGSGDDSGADGTDGTFRQTGYQDNSARLGGLSPVYYYGAVLNPELSNLGVLTLGAAVQPLRDSSLEVLWHRYTQDAPDNDVKGDLIDPPARPNGISTELGWGLDFVVTAPRLWNAVRAAWMIGIFEPGEAFAPRRDRAVVHLINVTVEL